MGKVKGSFDALKVIGRISVLCPISSNVFGASIQDGNQRPHGALQPVELNGCPERRTPHISDVGKIVLNS